MLSIAERVEQARIYVIDMFELDASLIDVVVAEWITDARDFVQVKIVVQNAIHMRVEVDPAGNADLMLKP